MGYVRGGETLESWCACCVRGAIRQDDSEVCAACAMTPDGASQWDPESWDCDGCGARLVADIDDEIDLGGGLYCGNCRDDILRGVEVARAKGITVTREPASDYYSTLINLDAIDAACKGGDEV
jgi:hypothetical protein